MSAQRKYLLAAIETTQSRVSETAAEGFTGFCAGQCVALNNNNAPTPVKVGAFCFFTKASAGVEAAEKESRNSHAAPV